MSDSVAMSNGERFYSIFARVLYNQRGINPTAWASIPLQEQMVWIESANAFMDAIPRPPDMLIPLTLRTWTAELLKYGRHSLQCPIGAPCTCGFAEVEKELKG